MATERVTERTDGVTNERVIERGGDGGTYVERSGGGFGGVLLGIAALALVAIIAFFVLSYNRNEAVRTEAVSDAASSVAGSAATAADSVGDAVNPDR